MRTQTSLAPAKINFGLRIVGRRDDGYHLLESLFVPLTLADEVSISFERTLPGAPEAREVAVELELLDAPETVPRDETNLVVRATRAWLAAAGTGLGIRSLRIVLRKRIPAAAGLGGGSSDAAATLRMLSGFFPEGPQGSALAEIALALGADVPFFLDPRPARVSGIGERIEPFEGLPELAVALVNPGISLSTAAVYRVFDGLSEDAPSRLTPPDPGPTMRALSGPGADPNALARLPGFSNDLEAAAVRLCPPVARLRDDLREAGALWAGMSGSGATVYGIFETEADAEVAIGRGSLPEASWTCVTRFQTKRLEKD